MNHWSLLAGCALLCLADVSSAQDAFARAPAAPAAPAAATAAAQEVAPTPRAATQLATTKEHTDPFHAGRRLIGVTTVEPDAGLLLHLGLPEGSVLQVREVRAGDPAEAAGVRVHDLIVAVDGQRPVSQEALRNAIQAHAPGEHVVLTVRRANQTLELPVEVREETSLNLFAGRVDVATVEPWRAAWGEAQRAHEVEAQLHAAVAQLEVERSTLESAQRALEQGQLKQRESLNQLAALGYLGAADERAQAEAEQQQRYSAHAPTDGSLAARLEGARLEVERAAAQLAEARAQHAQRAEALDALQLSLARRSAASDEAARYVEFMPGIDEQTSMLMLLGQERAANAQQAAARKRDVEALAQARVESTAAGATALDGRIDALEARLARIEELLERLASQR
jgi:hypothetical protein